MTEQEWDNEQLVKLLMRSKQWAEQVGPDERNQSTVYSASALAGDDRRSHPYQLSQAAWLSIFHAVDHLNTARLTVVEASTVPAVGLFALFRGTLETASRAAYLLAPAQRPVRLLRRLRVEAAEMANSAAAAELAGQTPPETVQQRRDRTRELARRMNIADDQDLNPVGYAKIISKAGQESPMGKRRPALVWKMCSGYAHGDRWPIIAVSELADLPGAPEGVRHLRVAAGSPALLLAAWTATEMVEHAWQLFDTRRRSPYQG